MLPAGAATCMAEGAMPLEEDHEHLTLAEAARLLGMPPKTLERWARAGRIASTVMASGQRVFGRSDLLRGRATRTDDLDPEQ